MKKTVTILILALLPGLAFADLADFGATTKAHKSGGFVVTGVFQETPASALGLAEGDIVIRIDGRKVQATTTLSRLVAGFCAPDSQITVDWSHDGAAMMGKTTLSRSLSEEAFAERYPDGGGSVFSKKALGHFSIEEVEDVDLGDDPGEIGKKIRERLEEQGMGGIFNLQLGSGGVTMSVIQMMTTPDGDKIKVNKKDDGKTKVTITTPEGETIFEETITAEELDKIPEAQRPFVKQLMKGGLGKVIIRGELADQPAPEKDASELLKEIEEEEGE